MLRGAHEKKIPFPGKWTADPSFSFGRPSLFCDNSTTLFDLRVFASTASGFSTNLIFQEFVRTPILGTYTVLFLHPAQIGQCWFRPQIDGRSILLSARLGKKNNSSPSIGFDIRRSNQDPPSSLFLSPWIDSPFARPPPSKNSNKFPKERYGFRATRSHL